MKVLQVITGIARKSGGPTRSVKGLCRALDRAGVEVTLLVLGGTDEFENPGGVKVVYGVRTELEFIQGFQLVHLHGLWSPKLHQVAVACRRAGVKYMVSPRGMLDPWALSVKKWKKRIARWLYQDRDLQDAAAFHATAELEAEHIRELGFRQPIIIAPNGVELPESGKLKVQSASASGRSEGLEQKRLGESLAGGDTTMGPLRAELCLAERSTHESFAPNCLASAKSPAGPTCFSSAISSAKQTQPSAAQGVLDVAGQTPGSGIKDRDAGSCAQAQILPQAPAVTLRAGTVEGLSAPHCAHSAPFLAPETGEGLSSTVQRVALFMGRLHPGKGLLTLAEAWKKVKKLKVESGKWRMVVVGPDDYGHKQEVVAKLEELGIKDEWEFVGMVGDEEKWEYYRQADLLIHPSVSENFGITIAEGLAAGLPVICTKGAPWKDIEEHKCGWWIDIGVETLVQALKEAMFLSDKDRQAMGERGQKLVAETYTWDAVAEKIIKGYEEVVK